MNYVMHRGINRNLKSVVLCVTHRAFSSGDVAGGEAYLSVAIAQEKRGFSHGTEVLRSLAKTVTMSGLPNTNFFKKIINC